MTYEQSIQEALQWWSYRQSIKLFGEAEKIRDSLLQETFAIRRSLDVLKIDHPNLLIQNCYEHTKKIDNFHHSLVQLSDRLCPVYIQESLPLSIQCLLEPWVLSNTHIYFHIDMPAYWQRESLEGSLIILRALEELLRITLRENFTPIAIYISLQLKENTKKLTVRITYSDLSNLTSYSYLPELNYLSDSLEFLMSGQCFYNSSNHRIAWYFCW
ncbi:hypothetical protein H6F47_22260 [Sphaerospermopsis sp. FACHB-1094]|uniref:hypothetical protein n=1 Tax=Sphaerospermopsis sp. FACHB-1094 TaxID=2692861 RepID=UPI001684194D|nr:hypothetical protein [Sphaerospermopsis sp. FACHB-1094]MBD2135063.1 hypothetical protein [Sphaerospermopsis sp. FACHB-1094]